MSENTEARSPAEAGPNVATPTSEASWLPLARFAAVAIQLALLFLIIRAYLYDQQSFREMFALACAGFLIHHFLPTRFRLPFFVVLSVAGAGFILGLTNAAWLIGTGLLLIGACHLPIRFPARLAVIGLLVGSLVAFRADWMTSPIPLGVWPILGSMFMFRLIVYLYDLKTQAAPFSFWRATAYFFMLPNTCFPLFPVVDYKTFCRTTFNDDAIGIYQVGVRWIFRGVVQLILYRFVYLVMQVSPSDIDSPTLLLQWMVSTFLLYLHVSGQFHIIVGILHLFGFNLPETNHLYLLSSSFTDFWRRINIYWRDFMMKVFFYPLHFWLKRFGNTKALLLATVITFVITWLLHSYQLFWIQGSFPITPQDIVFWGILGVLVTANVMYEFRSRRPRSRKKAVFNPREAAWQAARTVATFLTICTLWSIWTAGSLDEWLQIIRQVGRPTGVDLLKIGSVLLALAIGSVVLGGSKRVATGSQPSHFWRSAAVTFALAAVVFIVSRPAVHALFGTEASTIIASLRNPQLNKRDAALIERGYYEDLIHVDRMGNLIGGDLGGEYEETPSRPTHDFRNSELLPSASTVFRGEPFSTNRWGMRDRDYEMVKAPGTYRVALLGSSQAMGWGVRDDQTFENIVEDDLNQTNDGSKFKHFEILNFSMNGYGPIPKLMVLETRVPEFGVDAIVYASHSRELDWIANRLARAIRTKVDLPYEYLQEIADEAGVDSSMTEVVIRSRLIDYSTGILDWVYRRVVADCLERDILPLWIYIPESKDSNRTRPVDKLLQSAQDAGFIVIDLSPAYAGVSEDLLKVSQEDGHPNAHAHALLAEELERALRAMDGPFAPGVRGASVESNFE